MTPDRPTGPATLSQYRIDVLDHLLHEEWCDWKTVGECGCDAGQMLITLLAVERKEAAAAERARIFAALPAALKHSHIGVSEDGGWLDEGSWLSDEEAAAALVAAIEEELGK